MSIYATQSARKNHFRQGLKLQNGYEKSDSQAEEEEEGEMKRDSVEAAHMCCSSQSARFATKPFRAFHFMRISRQKYH